MDAAFDQLETKWNSHSNLETQIKMEALAAMDTDKIILSSISELPKL